MDLCITNFIGAILFLASLNALIHHIKNSYFQNKNYSSTKATGRVKNFKSGESETQEGTIFTY